MNNKPTPDQISKLPKWAQDHIRSLEMEREEAVKTLNQFTDEQTPSKVFFHDLACIGEQRGPSDKTKYVQTYKMTFRHGGVELEVYLRDKGSNSSGDCIDLSWSEYGTAIGIAALVPVSFQQVRLISRENMKWK